MSLQDDMETNQDVAAETAEPWLVIVGLGEDGWEGMGEEARRCVEEADIVAGGERQLTLIPNQGKEVVAWGSQLKSLVDELAETRGRKVCVLGTGDPMFYGIGSYFARRLKPGEMKIIPNLSILSLVCARLVWAEPEVQVVSLCGRPLASLNKALFDGARLLILCAKDQTAPQVAQVLRERGFGDSILHVFDYVGGPREAYHRYVASEVSVDQEFSDLNTLAVECIAAPEAKIRSLSPGLADEAYEHDGQLTKSEVRAVTLARLSPRPEELLWDIGAGAGSIGIEWMRAAPGAQAIAVEEREARAERAKRNADELGVPLLDVRLGEAPDILSDFPAPNAIFIGGGLGRPGMIEACWQALKPGGRLVANTVTLESEAILLMAHAERGGDLVRISIERASPVGRFEGWRPAMAVTQWAITKPYGDR